jgi:hypothetical protein
MMRVRSLAAGFAAVAAIASSGVATAAPAQASFAGPSRADSFSVTSTLAPTASAPALGWRDLVTGTTGAFGIAAADPAISPDGRSIAVITAVDADTFGVSLIDSQTGTVSTLDTPLSGYTDAAPFWSADGTTVEFTRASKTTSDISILEVPATGGPATLVIGSAEAGTAGPIGSTITYVESADSAACVVWTFLSGVQRCILSRAYLKSAVHGSQFYDVTTVRWSPDGSTLAVAYENDTGTGLAVLTPSSTATPSTFRILPASASTDLDETFTVIDSLTWTADGSQLIYSEGPLSVESLQDTTPGIGRSIDVATGGHVSTPIQGGNLGMDTYFPAPATPAGSEFVALNPARIAATKSGLGGRLGPLGPGGEFDLAVTGSPLTGTAVSVPANATAVVLNVTAVAPTRNTFVSVYPTPLAGNPVPRVSTLNPQVAHNTANAAVVAVGAGGKVRVYNSVGNVNVIVDIAGYYVPTGSDSAALPYASVTPQRIFSTISGVGLQPGVATGPIGPNSTRVVQVTGVGGVPTGASAVVVNLTGVPGSVGTYLTAFPADDATTGVSDLNLSPSETRANLATVKLSPDGKLTLYNAAGNTNVIVDVTGYFDAGAPNEYVPVAPLRILSTRDTATYAPGGASPLGAGKSLAMQVTGTLTTSAGQIQVPSTATAAVLNLTATSPTSLTYLSAYPAGVAPPGTSNVSLRSGTTAANLAAVGLGTSGQVTIYNRAGNTSVLADLAGYFRPITP